MTSSVMFLLNQQRLCGGLPVGEKTVGVSVDLRCGGCTGMLLLG